MRFDPLLIGFELSGTPYWYLRGEFWLCAYRKDRDSDLATWQLSVATHSLLEFPYKTTMSEFFDLFINQYPPLYSELHTALITHIKDCYRIFKIDTLIT